MEYKRRVPIYEGPVTKRFFDALRESNVQKTIEYIQRGDIQNLVIGVLMWAGAFDELKEIQRTAFVQTIADSNVLKQADRFKEPSTFRKDVDALRMSTHVLLKDIVENTVIPLFLERSETPPESE
jgi:hypothetical protein|tara:strand:- start:92 stop:466 length:375 start_codon:yes stop_codon:yes gene_type:complete